MLFSALSHHLSNIEATTKRLEMTTLLAAVYKELDPEEIQPISYLLLGSLLPSFETKEFQISTKMVIRALVRLGEVDEKNIVDKYNTLGDLGTVAQSVVQEFRSASVQKLSTLEVYSKLEEIANFAGSGSQEKKLVAIIELLSQLDALSARYVTRIILGKLRLGFSDMTIIDALSWVLKGDKSLHSLIEDAFQKRADIGYIAKMVLTKGIESLDSVKVKVGTPVIPALCQRLNSAEEIIEKMGEVYAEPKYDGTRVQLHYKREQLLKTFTRNLEESSPMFPELAQAVKTLDCESCILDAEAVGYDPKTGKLMLFQQTMHRKRKHGIEELSKDIPLRFFVFDILEKDGESLIQMPLSQRKAVLKKVFKDNEHFVHSPFIETNDATTLHEYHVDQLAKGLEGVVIKKTTSVYQSGRKGYSWVKIKEAEGTRGKLSDTVDAIVMGYFHAKGARTDFGVGSLLLGILNEKQEIVTVSKVGSGLSEEVAKEIMLKTKELKVKEMPKTYQVIKNLIPDVWITPEIVIEVAADEITISQVHTAGLALRFPRFVKFRDDKGWADATTLKELKTIVVS